MGNHDSVLGSSQYQQANTPDLRLLAQVNELAVKGAGVSLPHPHLWPNMNTMPARSDSLGHISTSNSKLDA
jgi:hypothetical protein